MFPNILNCGDDYGELCCPHCQSERIHIESVVVNKCEVTFRINCNDCNKNSRLLVENGPSKNGRARVWVTIYKEDK
jgi:hypothetical protein